MIFIKMSLYGYAFILLISLITWLFEDKIDLGEEEIQENITKDGKWN